MEWITGCIKYLRDHHYSRIEPSQQTEQEWVEHVNSLGSLTFIGKSESYFMGSNIPGKPRGILLYANTALAYRTKLAEVAAKGYEGFQMQ